MRIIKLPLRFAYSLVVGALLLLFLSNVWIVLTTQDKVVNDIELLPKGGVALVLGTSKRVQSGEPNPYFQYRMEAAANLYKQGVARHIILSGDNATKYYNEPQDMQNALVALGVPKEATTLDYAGLRTLDSIIRCKEIFGQDEVIIVTQKFHSYRALYISNFYQMNAVAYVAENVSMERSFQVLFREVLARPKAILDLYILGKKPAHMGEPKELSATK